MPAELTALLALAASLLLLDLAAIRFGVDSRSSLDPSRPPRRDI